MSKFSFFEKDFPAIDWFDITPADATDLPKIPRSVYVGGAGDLSIVSNNGNEVILTSVPAGSVLPIQPAQVSATATTATNIIGLI